MARKVRQPVTPLDRPLRLLPRVRNYDWGTPDFIPRLCGREPTGRPEAELWFGAHPDAPADVVLGSGEAGSIPLDRLIAERPVEVLGSDSALPFLTKVLSAGRPLSIQAHPSREQAARGFAAQSGDVNQPGDAAPDARAPASYRDPNHKPELLYALTPFSALSGFRPPAEAASLLGALGLEELEPHVRRLSSDGAAAYRPLLEALRGLGRTDMATRAVDAARRVSKDAGRERRDASRWIERIAAFHPNDPLVIAPLVLRLVHLDPGQVLFTGPGVPHSYLEGSGIEVMANSDNVLRLGLTSKRVDAAALLDILVYEGNDEGLLEPEVAERPWGRRVGFTPPVEDFRLEVLNLTGRSPAPLAGDDSVRIVLALEGEVDVCNAAGTERLRAGQAALLSASATAVSAAGTATVALTMPNRQEP